MLPKRKNLDKILKEVKDKKEKKAEEKRIKDLEAAEIKRKVDEEKLEKDIQGRIKHIEQDILYAIKEGRNATKRYYGNGRTPEPVWETAVARLKKVNKDYKFSIVSTSIQCNNYVEAANVDYVSAREWTEPTYKLEITW